MSIDNSIYLNLTESSGFADWDFELEYEDNGGEDLSEKSSVCEINYYQYIYIL